MSMHGAVARVSIGVVLTTALLTPAAAQTTDPVPCVVHRPHAGSTHPRSSCGMTKVGSLEVSTEAGLGQVEIFGTLAAVVERDEGTVAFVDVSDPAAPRLLSRYDGNTGRPELDDPYDGDLAFSSDGRWLFYARQTHDHSYDGLHVIDVSDRVSPKRVQYEPGGGTLRVAYHRAGDAEYVVTLDAVLGVVVHRFVRHALGGTVVPVAIDALPHLKVGGPASAGIHIEASDPVLKTPLMYVSTGRTGLDVYSFSDPANPVKLGSWASAGLADIAVVTAGSSRTVYAATEYWFAATTTLPRIVVLDASDLASIRETARFSPAQPSLPTGPLWRPQGLDVSDGRLYAAHSHAGLAVSALGGADLRPTATTTDLGDGNPGGGFGATAPYAMDVETVGDLIYVTDAVTGALSIFRLTPAA